MHTAKELILGHAKVWEVFSDCSPVHTHTHTHTHRELFAFFWFLLAILKPHLIILKAMRP